MQYVYIPFFVLFLIGLMGKAVVTEDLVSGFSFCMALILFSYYLEHPEVSIYTDTKSFKTKIVRVVLFAFGVVCLCLALYRNSLIY